ncbi:MAG: hypothetical protein WCG27_10915, partial [Pseudomonadota bacterium]
MKGLILIAFLFVMVLYQGHASVSCLPTLSLNEASLLDQVSKLRQDYLQSPSTLKREQLIQLARQYSGPNQQKLKGLLVLMDSYLAIEDGKLYRKIMEKLTYQSLSHDAQNTLTIGETNFLKLIEAKGIPLPEAMRESSAIALQKAGIEFTPHGLNFKHINYKELDTAEAADAFQEIFPEARFTWKELINPNRRTVIVLGDYAFLPPATNRTNSVISLSEYQRRVDWVMTIFKKELKDMLVSSNSGSGWKDLFLNYYGFRNLEEIQEIPDENQINTMGAHDRALGILRHLRDKKGLPREQILNLMSVLTNVVINVNENSLKVVDDLIWKAKVFSVSVPVVAAMPFAGVKYLYEGFVIGMGMNATSWVTSAVVDSLAAMLE